MIHTAVCPKFEITSANFRGTVEKSFGVRQLKRLLSGAGLELVSLERHVCTASEWKMAEVSPVHAFLRRFYVLVSKRMLWLLGNVTVIAQKPESVDASASDEIVVAAKVL